MVFEDLRQFLSRLDEEGELQRISVEVDWNGEAGAITRRCIDLHAPAPLFENIKGYPPGFKLFGCPLGPTRPVRHGRVAIALGLPKDTSTEELIEKVRERLRSGGIRPRIVTDAPCKEIVLRGDKIDLYKFPTPLIHSGDGGRFIGTWHVNVTTDPDTGAVNWGMYRHQIHDKTTLGMEISPSHHGALNLAKYKERKQNMPMAIAIGTEPVSTMAAGISLPHPPGEDEIAGALRGRAVDLVKCETIDLYVPATSEIVIEGYVSHDEEKLEGPFGEYTGYNAGGVLPRPVFHTTCITHRNNPILTMSNMGKLWDENAVLNEVFVTAMLRESLSKRGFVYKSLFVPAPSFAVIVSVKPRYPGYAHTLASAIWSSDMSIYTPYVCVVGEDVDVTNMNDVFWCLVTRMHPSNGISIERGIPSHTLVPYLTPEEKKTSTPIGARALFDATFPYEWPKDFTPQIVDWEHAWSKEAREKVVNRWSEYGYKS